MKLLTTAGVFAAAASVSIASMGSVSATQNKFLELEVKPICSVAAENIAVWEMNNKNAQTITIDWLNADTSYAGEYDAEAGLTYFATDYEAGLNNRTEFYGTRSDDHNPISRNATNVECDADQIPGGSGADDGTGTDNGNTGGTTTPAVGGSGADEAATSVTTAATTAASTNNAAPVATTLANTGAPSVMAYSAAALVALFTTASAVLVRKNRI